MVRGIAVCVGVLIASALAWADEPACPPLRNLTTLEMTLTKNGQVRIPVRVGEQDRTMILDTGAAISALWPDAADALNLERVHTSKKLSDVLGNISDYLVVLPQFSLGRLKTENQKVFVFPGSVGQGGDDPHAPGSLIGLFGADFLRMYDVDVDFGQGKVRLVSQNHCPGKVVYWNPTTFAEIPMRLDAQGHIIVTVMLDGVPVRALLDTGATRSVMMGPFAARHFDLVSAAEGHGGIVNNEKVAGLYRHTFKRLEMGGVAIANPTITITPDVAAGKRTVAQNDYRSLHDGDGHDMLLGIHELKALHLFIDYKDKTLFVSAAGDYGQGADAAPGSPSVPKP